uniref:Uncharacterized protein n=1 Tax=Anguilla anguilla TaxID=7936 RepID=A0A0E9UC92_ANGAN
MSRQNLRFVKPGNLFPAISRPVLVIMPHIPVLN